LEEANKEERERGKDLGRRAGHGQGGLSERGKLSIRKEKAHKNAAN